MAAGPPARRFARADDVVWRIAPDRVIVRRSSSSTGPTPQGGHPPRTEADEASDLFGDAALAWTALDTPATLDTIAQRLDEAGVDRAVDAPFAAAVNTLVACGWLVEADR